MGWGGPRPNSGGKRAGAGRKPKLTTIIRAQALAAANGDAEYALGLVVGIMRDEKQPMDWRYAASLEVMDRVWGKSTERQEMSGLNGGEVVFKVVYGDASTGTGDKAP